MLKTKTQKQLTGWFLTLPGLLLYSFIIIVPSLATFRYSFFDWNGLGEPVWVGLKNYIDIVLKDWVFRIALVNNIEYTLIFLSIPMILGLIVAYLNMQLKTGKKIYQTIIYIPVVVASVVTSRIWHWIYHPFFGPIAQLTDIPVLNVFTKFNLGNPDTALYAIAVADMWHWWGFPFVIYYSAFRQIDPQLYEAARIDGAKTWQVFYKVALPLIKPSILFLYLMQVIWAFMVFDYVYIMTRGGPGHASELATTWIYDKAFVQFEAGYACALAIYLTLICSLFVGIYLYLKRKGWEAVG